MDVQRSLSDRYNKCDLAHDTRSQLGAQEALQRAHRVRNARVCKKRHKGVHLGLDPVGGARAQSREGAAGRQLTATTRDPERATAHPGVRAPAGPIVLTLAPRWDSMI